MDLDILHGGRVTEILILKCRSLILLTDIESAFSRSEDSIGFRDQSFLVATKPRGSCS